MGGVYALLDDVGVDLLGGVIGPDVVQVVVVFDVVGDYVVLLEPVCEVLKIILGHDTISCASPQIGFYFAFFETGKIVFWWFFGPISLKIFLFSIVEFRQSPSQRRLHPVLHYFYHCMTFFKLLPPG